MPISVLDLHTHSHFSDGRLAPAELVREAAARQVSVLALTDHDTLSGIAQARHAAAAAGVNLITGLELSVKHETSNLHLLGYGVDEQEPALNAAVERLRVERGNRLRRILVNLRRYGIELDEKDIKRECPVFDQVGRPHIARAMVNGGWTQNFRTAFDDYLGDRAPAYEGIDLLDAGEGVRLILDAGGLAVLAHPTTLRLGKSELTQFVGMLNELGMEGIEVDSPAHNRRQRLWLKKLADDLGLVQTGGSDFHDQDMGRILGNGTAGMRLKHDKFAPFLERIFGTVANIVVRETTESHAESH